MPSASLTRIRRRGVGFLDCVETGQRANLIADDAVGPVLLPRVAPQKAQVGPGSDDKEAAGLVQAMQFLEVDIAPIHDVESTGFRHQHVEDIDLVPLAIADVNEAGDLAENVEQRVHFHCGVGRTERRPWKCRQAQVDSRCIQGIDRVGQIDAEGLGCIQVRATQRRKVVSGRCAMTYAKTSLPVFINTLRSPVGRTGNATSEVQIETSLRHGITHFFQLVI